LLSKNKSVRGEVMDAQELIKTCSNSLSGDLCVFVHSNGEVKKLNHSQ